MPYIIKSSSPKSTQPYTTSVPDISQNRLDSLFFTVNSARVHAVLLKQDKYVKLYLDDNGDVEFEITVTIEEEGQQ
jgi:hypothetical protein